MFGPVHDHLRHDPLSAAGRVIERLEGRPALPSEDTFFGWHPLPLAEFVRGVEEAREVLVDRNKCWSGEESFLDVGCGLGSKMGLVSALGWGRVEGVERWPPFVAECRRVWPEFPVHEGDAYDFDGYDRFDVVYSYRLCVDVGVQRRLTERIVSRMRRGALLFLAGGPDPVLRQVGSSVWEV